MRKLSVAALIIIAGFSLSSCGEKNPLQKHDLKKIAAYLYENTGPAIGHCAKFWGNPKAANRTVLKNCEEQAFFVAEKLTQNGYGEISSRNIKKPEIWTEFLRIGAEKKANQKPFTFNVPLKND